MSDLSIMRDRPDFGDRISQVVLTHDEVLQITAVVLDIFMDGFKRTNTLPHNPLPSEVFAAITREIEARRNA